MVYSSVAVDPALSGNPDILGGFCRAVRRIVQGSAKKETPARVATLLPGLLSEPRLLSAAQRVAPVEGYGRHTVFTCPDDLFSVLAMVWPPGVSTPVHDHLSWCAFGVYEGMVEETRFCPAARPSGAATAVATARMYHRAGDVGHLPVDAHDIHRMHNPTGALAVSIHVYGGNLEKLGPNLGRVYAVEG